MEKLRKCFTNTRRYV